MKKLIIAAAIVCAAVASPAGVVKWGVTSMKTDSQIYAPDGTTLAYAWSTGETPAGTVTAVYLINAATLSQDNLLKGIREATDAATYFANVSKVDSRDINNSSKVKSDNSPEIPGGFYDFYVAMLATDAEGNNSILISNSIEEVPVPSTTGANAPATWSDATFSKLNHGSANFTDTGAGAGWYTVVPEPTSGLLLLLGVAGLALRRRRA